MTEPISEYFNEGTPFKFTSPSMGVDTKPAHRFEVGEFWVLIDPNMPKEQFETVKRLCAEDTFDKYEWREKYYRATKSNESLVKQIEQLQAELNKLKGER